MKNKKILIIIGVALVIVGIITGVILLNNNNKLEPKKEENSKPEIKQETNIKIQLKEDLTFDINSEVKLLSLIDENNEVEITSEDEVIDTSSLGEKDITIRYLDNEKEEQYLFKINIVDIIAPKIEFKKELKTTLGNKIDLLKNVKVTDNSNEEINVTVEGNYDFNKSGEYTLKYIAIDSSNNKKEEEFILKVEKNDISDSNDSKDTNNKLDDVVNNNQDTNDNNTSDINNSDNNTNSTNSNEDNNETNKESIKEYKQSEAKTLFSLINNKRKQNNLNELKWNTSLESSAKVRTKELVTSFSSTRPNQKSYETAITIKYLLASELIAKSAPTAESLIDKINISNKEYTDIGISLYYDSESDGKYYWVILTAEVDKQEAEYRQTQANKMITLINNARKENGLSELSLNSSLESSAKIRAKELVTNYSHTRPNNTSPFTTITINYIAAGENIAAGQGSVEEVFEAWMNSPGHRSNILSEVFTDIGISWYYDPDSTYKYHWVQLFIGQ